MRQARQKQLNLVTDWLAFDHAKELQAIAGLLDEHPMVAELVLQDLGSHQLLKDTGAEGLSAEQVLRALIIKQLNGFSYRELVFHLADSVTYRRFCLLGWNQTPSKSGLATCIKAIHAGTLERINRLVVGVAQEKKIEDGKKVRVDTTVVESNIHRPLDSNLLWDSVRVVTRLMGNARDILGSEVGFPIGCGAPNVGLSGYSMLDSKRSESRCIAICWWSRTRRFSQQSKWSWSSIDSWRADPWRCLIGSPSSVFERN